MGMNSFEYHVDLTSRGQKKQKLKEIIHRPVLIFEDIVGGGGGGGRGWNFRKE